MILVLGTQIFIRRLGLAGPHVSQAAGVGRPANPVPTAFNKKANVLGPSGTRKSKAGEGLAGAWGYLLQDGVLVSWGRRCEVAQIWSLKTTETYSLTLLEAKIRAPQGRAPSRARRAFLASS